MQTKIKLCVVTAFYPHGFSEPFLENEIKYLSNHFNVEIFPLLKFSNNNNIRKIPKNVVLHDPLLKRNYFIRFFNGLINSSPIFPFFKNLILLLYQSKNKKRSFTDWLMQMITFRSIYSSKRLKKTLKSPDSILYYYWGTMPIKLFKNINNLMLIRVHGGEIELERNNNYIPLLKEKFDPSNKRIYLPISTSADKQLKKFNSQLNTKIARLGVADNGLNPKPKDNIITIVSCSSLIPLKRVHLIVYALTLIDKHKVHWIHFGGGALYDEIQYKIKSLSSNILVDFKGQVSNYEVINFYKNNPIDLFINVSETEGVPVSIMEALSFGIPCFATDVGGTSEIVDDSVGKLVKKDFDVKDLMYFITNIKELSDKNNLSRNAREKWFNKCNSDKNYNDLIHFINEVSPIKK